MIEKDHDKAWASHASHHIMFCIESVWEHPPYQNVVRKYVYMTGSSHKKRPKEEDALEDSANDKEASMSICSDCSLFFKKKYRSNTSASGNSADMVSQQQQPAKHPMHVCVDFILSGGCSTKPSSSVLIHGIQSMLCDFPKNPIFESDDLRLFHIMGSVKKYAELFSSSMYDLEEFACILKWMWCGSQQILVDEHLAKLLRKYNGDHPGYSQWWKKKLPSACRFCNTSCKPFHELVDSNSVNFALVVASGTSTVEDGLKWIQAEVEKIESFNKPLDHISAFCTKCCQLSVISYEYDVALKTSFEIPPHPKQWGCTSTEETGASSIRYYLAIVRNAATLLQTL